MSYNPTNWINGETKINDTNLNHIEQGIKDVSDLSDEQETKIAEIANNQIPEEYLQQSVDNYIANNQSGLATKTDVANLDSKLSSEIEDIKESVEFDGRVTNLYNSSYDIEGYWIEPSGNISYHATSIYALIPIISSKNVYITYRNKDVYFASNAVGGINLYNANNELISTLKIEDYKSEKTFEGYNYAVIPIPDTVAKLALITKLSTTWDARETLIVTYDDLSKAINGGAGEVTKIDGAELKDLKARELLADMHNRKWVGKIWVCVGDSLTEANSRTSKNYHDYVAEETGITIVNMGSSGSGYLRDNENNKAFYQRISSLPTDADVVTIFGSFNDMSAGVAVGTVDDSGITTLAGAINLTIDNLFATYPLAKVGIVTPTPWVGFNENSNSNVDKEYVQLIIDICKKRGIPCLDLYHNSGLRPWEESYRNLCYSRDDGNGVHPDETGHALIAPRFKAFLETLIF